MATVHMICGFLGAGKTTYAKEIASQSEAMIFSLDELYLRLFADGPTFELDIKRMDRLLDVLEGLWRQAVQLGFDVVLDYGFWSRALRDHVRSLSFSLGADSMLHWLRCSDELALERCLGRNGASGAFLISEEGFWKMHAHFEAPNDDERARIIETDPLT